MGKFWEFLKAVFSHWETVMSGVIASLFFYVIGLLYATRTGADVIPWYVYVFVALSFAFYGCYRAWLEKVLLLTKATEDRPRFIIRLHGAVAHFDPAQGVTLMIVPARVLNQGTPSAITDYFVHYQTSEIQEKGKLIQLREPLSLTLSDKQIFIVRPEDNISTKIDQPIPRGGYVLGKLLFVISGNRTDDLGKKETKITVIMKDSWENEYSKELLGGGSQTLTHIPGDTIPPGSKGIGPDNPEEKEDFNQPDKEQLS